MADETKVKVKLDTRQAKAELGGLVRESARAAGKVASGIRSTVGRGLGAVGFGAAIGTGVSAVRFLLGDLDENARATKSAREETIQAFGAIAGGMNGGKGGMPPGAQEFFTSVKSLRVQQERGREVFERGLDRVGLGDIVTRIGSVIGTELGKAVDNLVSKIPFVGGK
jgi:hypothetical protein